MGRKAKLAGDSLKQFLLERDGGLLLSELSKKYGLTEGRLSQIYKANRPLIQPVQLHLEIEEPTDIEIEELTDKE